jgi:hypothetical protein
VTATVIDLAAYRRNKRIHALADRIWSGASGAELLLEGAAADEIGEAQRRLAALVREVRGETDGSGSGG